MTDFVIKLLVHLCTKIMDIMISRYPKITGRLMGRSSNEDATKQVEGNLRVFFSADQLPLNSPFEYYAVERQHLREWMAYFIKMIRLRSMKDDIVRVLRSSEDNLQLQGKLNECKRFARGTATVYPQALTLDLLDLQREINRIRHDSCYSDRVRGAAEEAELSLLRAYAQYPPEVYSEWLRLTLEHIPTGYLTEEANGTAQKLAASLSDVNKDDADKDLPAR